MNPVRKFPHKGGKFSPKKGKFPKIQVSSDFDKILCSRSFYVFWGTNAALELKSPSTTLDHGRYDPYQKVYIYIIYTKKFEKKIQKKLTEQ